MMIEPTAVTAPMTLPERERDKEGGEREEEREYVRVCLRARAHACEHQSLIRLQT